MLVHQQHSSKMSLTHRCIKHYLRGQLNNIPGNLLKTQAPDDLLQDQDHTVLIKINLTAAVTLECLELVHMILRIILKTQNDETPFYESFMTMMGHHVKHHSNQTSVTPLTNQCMKKDVEVLFSNILEILLNIQTPGDLLHDLGHKVLITGHLMETVTPECVEQVHMIHKIILKTETQEALLKESSMTMTVTVHHTSKHHFT